MASLLTVRLSKGDSPSWGFRLQGGKDFGTPLVIQKVIVGSPAERAGLIAGDSVIRVNNTDVFNLRHKDAQDVLLRSGNTFDMTIQRGGSTWKPSVIPTGTISTHSPTINNVSPVTRTSLAAKPSENIGAIGTGHNVSAKPFLNGAVNGGPKLVNTQYNSPLKLYSEESIAETLSAQTEVLSTGALGVNFKKNEKNYDASKSAVLSLLKEEESSPRSQDHTDNHQTSGIETAASPVGIAGLRHVIAPETKPQPPSPQLPPGQNICADCERLIVGVFVRIKDKNLHVECFKCSTCGTSLKNVGYYNINNKLYCDVHAKLAARNNPAAPNLVPITVPPGGKAPANAITAALASHPYPTSAPLSPKINSYSAPLSGPKLFGSVPGPLSPASNFNSLPRTGAPLSPVVPISAPAYSPVSTTVQSVTNIVWPPVQEEPDLPSACPLFYPPPSQVVIKPRKRLDSKDSNSSELEEINKMEQYNYPNYDDVISASGRRSATECVETIAETLDRQMLVETIIRSRPQSPPPSVLSKEQTHQKQQPPPEQKEEKIVPDDTNVCNLFRSNLVESDKQMKTKIENPVPKKWESQMLQALTIKIDEPSSNTSSLSNLDSIARNEINDDKPDDSFAKIPTKQTSTPLGSALAVAPKEPFNPNKTSILEPVPLPEETVPYFPPENLFAIPLKEPQGTENVRPFKKKKDPNVEKLMEELPKPNTKLSLLSALTTAPDRPFTPISFEKVVTEKSEMKSSTQISETKTTKSQVTESVRPTNLQYALQVQGQEDQTPSPECLPLFQGFSCSFQNKTDHSKFDVQISTTPPVKDRKLKKQQPSSNKEESNEIKETIKTETTEKTSKIEKSSTCVKEEIQMTEEKDSKSVGKKKESILYKKPEQMVSLRKPQMLPQYQVTVKQNAEADIILMERMEKAKQKKEQERIQKETQNTQIVTSESKSHKQVSDTNISKAVLKQPALSCPEIKLQEVNIYSDNNTFRPVIDSRPQSCTISPKPRPLTPSMVNKPPPVIPYYQANLVAQRYGPPTVNFLDPRSPAISRSPSPLPNISRSSHLISSSKQSNIRSKSPAQGPPCNPMQQECLPTMQDFKLEGAKDNLVAFIPQYKEIRDARDDTTLINKGKESRNDQRNIMYTSDVVTKKEGLPVFSVEATSRIEELSSASENKQQCCKMQETNIRQTADSQKEECQSRVSGHTESTIKVSEKSHLEKSEDYKKMEDKSIERSEDGSIQIQRKKTVTEEVEHTQKSQEIVIEKNVTSSNQQGFRNVRNPEENNQHVIGLHVTAPNPIRSPFLKSAQNAVPPKLTTICQKVGKDIPCKKPDVSVQCPKKQEPIAPKFDATTLPQPKSIPGLPKITREEKVIPPKSIKHVNAPGSSKLNQQLNPSVPPSDIGAGGGRQTGAIGISPKRGRGVLNSAQLGGRIALCGHCHGQIRGPFITALGKIWCPSHFICATPSCRRPLQDLGFVEEQGQLYCEYCFEQYLAPNCSKCGSKIKGDCLKAIGKAFHPECFNCVHCGKLFGNTPFFLEDGSPYCETDWNEMFTTKCYACGFPVEAGDRWVEALNNNYHSQCFNCTMCKKNLEGQSFFAKGGRPYCKNHAR